MIETILAYIPVAFDVLEHLITVAAIIVALTPTKADDDVVDRIRNVVAKLRSVFVTRS